MEVLTARYSKDEFARRGDEIYERDIKPRVSKSDEGKFVVIDIETGDYEIDRDEIVAHDRLALRHPDAQVWLTKVGRGYARRRLARLHRPVSK
ncbi:MAG TPA: hypothetical protein VN937_29475 [Blastocatellia bacterium]|nr:hypothetical protein [Blastocatellia bacterium]